jgi:group I intron endonuclease
VHEKILPKRENSLNETIYRTKRKVIILKIYYNDTWKVYVHQNMTNGKMYIGITSMPLNKRFERNGAGYKHHNVKFWRAIQKYGWNNFEHILFADHLTEDEANNIESFLIDRLNTIAEGYNCRGGGKAGKLSEHAKQLIKEKRAKQIINYESIKKSAEKNKGKKRSEQFKENSRNAKRKYMKKVYCLETDSVYESITKAAKELGLSKSFVSQVCNNIISSAHGYHLSFVKSND